MAVFTPNPALALTFGVLGNIISLMVYLAPMRTFHKIYKKKSTGNFQAVPYVLALLSSLSWIYYAFLKADAFLLITINTVGVAIEAIYLTMFFIYAPRNKRILTSYLLLLNVGVCCLVFFLTFFLVEGPRRVTIVGWVCIGIAATVFAAPLGIMRRVIRTKSIEYMPFTLSFFLTLSAVMWFSYGVVLKDHFIAIPNVLGFTFGVIQMVLYMIYKRNKNVAEAKLPEQNFDVVKPITIGNSEVHGEHNTNEKCDKSEKNPDPRDDSQMIRCQV